MMRFASEAFFEVEDSRRASTVAGADTGFAPCVLQRWAKTGEFQALMKARPAAGDVELGEQYIAALMPMVWTACEREDFVPEVQAMSSARRGVGACRRGAASSSSAPAGCETSRISQCSCSVHGRNDESLHVASTIDALGGMSAGGWTDAANLTASYEFLRLSEHRLPAAAPQAHAHAAGREQRGDAMAGACCPHEAGRSARLHWVCAEVLKRQSHRVSRLHAKAASISLCWSRSARRRC